MNLPDLTEQQFIYVIDKYTGKSFENGDYGFILGTHAPFKSYGLHSATMKPGFTVWVKIGEQYKELDIEPGDQKSYAKKIIEFINDSKVFRIKLKKTK